MQQLQAAESSENIKTRRACDAWLHRGNPSFRSWRGYGRILALARNISHLEGVRNPGEVARINGGRQPNSTDDTFLSAQQQRYVRDVMYPDDTALWRKVCHGAARRRPHKGHVRTERTGSVRT